VDDSRVALAAAAALWHQRPSEKLRVAGVTGTNGKTTTTFLLHALIEKARHRAGMLGTVHYDLGDTIEPATHTTPESLEIQGLLARMRDADCRGVAMEVSSHALSQHRVDSVAFDAAIFTNLTQDHLDYHRTMEAYFESKASLGELLCRQTKKKPVFVINKDDGYGQRLIRRFRDRLPLITYGMSVGSDFRATRIAADRNGTRFELEAKGRTFLVRLPLIGRYNVYNAMAALAATKAMGLNLRESVRHLETIPQIPGRLEAIHHRGGFQVYVDYAHTPDALENVLQILRDLSPRRLICVFGCGGNRDRGKRALMGQAAERFSDYAVLTSDNPRTESPAAILEDITKGFRGQAYQIVEDRAKAIREALSLAQEGDIVLIAGKGHEAEQQFADHTIAFDDRDEAYKALQVLDHHPQRERERGGPF
jgi:UDP-N-acetylmuramoyl-L-alanyl-D-glutamate--2,6-diaminopimelate ligase